MNHPKYSGASILVAGPNFGSGSSREHAPWALYEYGFKVIISTSFADIFRNNCMQNGLITVQLSSNKIDTLMTNSIKLEKYKLTVDLENQKVTDEYGFEEPFDFDQFRKDSILKGLDDIGITLQFEDDLDKFETNLQN